MSAKVPTVVFIAGLGRSGSTLLDRLLGQLPGWWSLGEVLHVWQRGLIDDELCGCGERFSACSVWQAIGKEAFGGWHEVDVEAVLRLKQSVERDRFVLLLLNSHLRDDFATRLDHYNGILTLLFNAAAKVTGATTIVDSGKHASASLVLRMNRDIDLRLVHLVRDSRGVAFSMGKVVPRLANAGQTNMHRSSSIEASIRYVAYNSLLTAVYRSKRYCLRYEDLVAVPDRSIAGLCSWASRGRCVHDGHVDQPIDFKTSHGFSGNPQRMRSGPIKLNVDDEWRQSMSAREKLLVTALTSPSLLQYGYSLNVTSST